MDDANLPVKEEVDSQMSAMQRAIDKAWGNMSLDLMNAGDSDLPVYIGDEMKSYRTDAMSRRMQEAM